MTTSEGDAKAPFFKGLHKNPFVIAFVLGATLLTLLGPVQRLFLHAPPALATIEPWSLTDQNNQPFGSAQLKGKVWVADYFFTRCPSICPELTRKMKRVQQEWAKFDDVHFVSFTVDPEHDTPAILAAYADQAKIDTHNWSLLSGSFAQVHDVVRKKMFMHIGEKTPRPEAKQNKASSSAAAQEALFDISHLGKFALFDQNGDLRATFSTDDEGLGALGNAARLLLDYGPNP